MILTDGVLNTDYSTSTCVGDHGEKYLGIDDDKVKQLKRIVDATGAKIVLSSDWRLDYQIGTDKQINKCSTYLYDKMRKQDLEIYDKTVDIQWALRDEEVKTYLDQHEVEEFVILDDRPFFMARDKRLTKHFILTNAKESDGGLTPKLADFAIEILNGNHIGPVFHFEDRVYE